MIHIEMNGKKIEIPQGAMIIEVADALGIQIPRFCYHKKLSIAANCRMCLVDVEKSAKPLPACATPVTDGMKIWTRSEKALSAQKEVMEFLLINHPLDCPICDQGGECELQDVAMGYGKDHSRYNEGKRTIKDQNLGPLIATDMTRCIQCTRCVRFGTEVAGLRELGATQRGEDLEIGTYIEQTLESELSGNIIDLCPVGALTSKPFRFTARAWELTQRMSVSPHDCVGSNLFVHQRNGQVMRVVPKENEMINEVWLSDRDRFSYEGLLNEERLKEPKIKHQGRWRSVSWQEALTYTVERLQIIKAELGGEEIGAFAAPSSTLEEFYLLQKLLRVLGSNNIDHRLKQTDFKQAESMPLFPHLGCKLEEIEHLPLVLLVGSHIRKEQPILNLKLNKLAKNHGQILVINPIDFETTFPVAEKSIVPKGDLVFGLSSVLKSLLDHKNAPMPTNINSQALFKQWEHIKPTDVDDRIASILLNTQPNTQKVQIFLGELATTHPDYAQILFLANLIATVTGGQIGVLTEGANTAGAWLAGAVPHRLAGGKPCQKMGLNTQEMIQKHLQSYILFNIDPHLDCVYGSELKEALTCANTVLAITPFESEYLREVAHIMLPMTPFTETDGTFVNVAGVWQSFNAVTKPYEESRPGWKILRVLGNLLNLPDFEYSQASEIREEAKRALENTEFDLTWNFTFNEKHEWLFNKETFIRIAPVPMYATDGLVRRAKSLQKMQDAGNVEVRLHPDMIKKIDLKGSKAKIVSNKEVGFYPYSADDKVPVGSILLVAGKKETAHLGMPYAEVEVKNV